MAINLVLILKIIDEILALEKKLAAAAASETNVRRRKALLKACKDRDLAKVKELIFGID